MLPVQKSRNSCRDPTFPGILHRLKTRTPASPARSLLRHMVVETATQKITIAGKSIGELPSAARMSYGFWQACSNAEHKTSGIPFSMPYRMVSLTIEKSNLKMRASARLSVAESPLLFKRGVRRGYLAAALFGLCNLRLFLTRSVAAFPGISPSVFQRQATDGLHSSLQLSAAGGAHFFRHNECLTLIFSPRLR